MPAGGQPTAAEWDQRRILPEHAVIEDCGAELGVSALVSWLPQTVDAAAPAAQSVTNAPADPGFVPLAGRTEGEPGFLARRTVLGRPARLAESP
jgi:hypothetical protein